MLHDMLGISMDFSRGFLRRYLNLSESIDGAIRATARMFDPIFPNEEESYAAAARTPIETTSASRRNMTRSTIFPSASCSCR